MVRLFTFYGNSNTGKTTMVMKIVEELKNKGYRVVYLKNTDRDRFDFEKKGKDTERVKSDIVLGRANFEYFMRVETNGKVRMEDILSIPAVKSSDYLLIEGNHEFPSPKILFLSELEDLKRIDRMTVGVFSNDEKILKNVVKEDILVFGPKDEERLVEFVEKAAVHPLPNINCELCGYRCDEMARLIALGQKSIKDCKILNLKRVDVRIDGRRIDLVPFLENILKDVILGVLKNLKGYKDVGDVEVKIRR